MSTEADVHAGAGRLYCYRCGHFWRSRSEGLPRICPRCRTSRWNDPVSRQAVCRFCGTEWRIGSLDEPCPGCGHGIFESPDPSMLRCGRCDYEWRPRSDSRPTRCPVCRSTRWDAPRPVRHTCRICGNVWSGSSVRPSRCPSCKSTVWDRPVYRAQCRQCGHRWILKNGRTSSDVKRCPSCGSERWMEPPLLDVCPSCGFGYACDGTVSRICPGCRGRSGFGRRVCGFCGMGWGAMEGSDTCPRCGRRESPDDRCFVLWSDGVFTLRYAFIDGFAFVYLWEDGRPVAASYFHDVCAELGVTRDGFVDALNRGSLKSVLRALSRRMFSRRFDYLEKVDYFMKRLGLSEEDAIILAVHFSGMGPEAIALYLKRSLRDVRLAFDRIMAAYEDSGIVVDDTVFTDDPFSFYRCAPTFSVCVPRCAHKLVILSRYWNIHPKEDG